MPEKSDVEIENAFHVLIVADIKNGLVNFLKF